MMATYRSIFILILMLASSVAFALAPLTGEETPCSVTGEVLGLEKVEASDMRMNRLWVPLIRMEIKDIRAVDPAYKGKFCDFPEAYEMPQLFKGKKHVNGYRDCDGTVALKPGDIIKGVAGKSLGGGPYCIEKIEILKRVTD